MFFRYQTEMRRSDIKKGTIYIMTFAVVFFFMIWFMRKMPATQSQTTVKDNGIAWSDTLTNKASEIPALAGMDNEIERFRNKWEIKGISIAVSRNDSLLFAKGYGWADREAGIPMSPGSIMRIASASKLVTATAIMKLVEQGRLRLDSKIFGDDGILNDTSFTNSVKDRRIFDITVDHLLQHKGGFTLGAGDPMFNTADIMEVKHLKTPPDNRQLTGIVLGRRLGFQPGSGRRYSNFGYMLLSLVIEKVSGKNYWDYVTEEILRPAGAFRFRPARNYYTERHPDETKYYGPDTVKIKEFNGSGRMVDRVYGGSNVNGLLGAGGWATSASDLARLVAAIDGHPGVRDILSPSSVAQMTYHDGEDKQTRGWSDSDGKGKWSRTGTLGSTHALIIKFPEGDCWVMTTNSGVWTGHNFSHDMMRLVDNLRRRYSGSLPRRNLW